VCSAGSCVSDCFIAGTLYPAGTVNPGNACQLCTPASSTTTWSNEANGTSCSTGNKCNSAEVCTAGVCGGGTTKTCTASDQCHVAGTCDPTTGNCSNPTAANGTSCSTGNKCNSAEVCTAGVCGGGTTKTCTASDQCHIAGTCDPTTGNCSNPTAANGTSCSTGNKCNTGETCTAGVCGGGTTKTCTASDQCHIAGTCDPTSGNCSNPTATDGTACSTGNNCMSGESCTTGVCGGGIPKICVASDQCHVAGLCDPTSGNCSNPAATDGTTCSTGNNCMSGESCTTGVCGGGTAKTCAPSDQCHVAGTCDPVSGNCSNPTAADGTTCSSGNQCMSGETCTTGVCGSGTAKSCTAQDACHVAGTCDPASGNCSNPTAPDGTVCPGGTCSSGSCALTPDMAQTAIDMAQAGDMAQATGGDMAQAPGDLSTSGDLAAGASPDLSMQGTGGVDLGPIVGGGANGCGCVVGARAPSEVGWPIALVALALVGLALRRRRRSVLVVG
jgi:MYXO-CTERM domain-containing protein